MSKIYIIIIVKIYNKQLSNKNMHQRDQFIIKNFTLNMSKIYIMIKVNIIKKDC